MSETTRRFTILRKSDQQVIADQCDLADSFFKRFRGKIGAKDFPRGQGLLFPRCNDIHMWFMSIPIDVVFLRRVAQSEYQISSVRSALRPWKAMPVRDSRATDTLELPAGVVENLHLKAGDLVCIS